ncbi:hypothetical protein [Pseudomonas brassicacearum]|uniref:hypothetical protein n=1 Tax=Pseudomonas brassicacearum TaxID=930166 RepID=UPI003D6A935C
MCDDGNDDNTPKHSRIVICPFSGQSKQWVNTRENWRKARRSKIEANTERTDLADYEFFTFDGPSKKRLKERLQSCIGPDEVIYIFGHCAPGSIELSKEVSASSESITAFALAKILKDGVSLNKNFAGKIKIYGCNSALPNGAKKSFAHSFACIMKLYHYDNCEIHGYAETLVDGYVGAHKIATSDSALVKALNTMIQKDEAFGSGIDAKYNEDHALRPSKFRQNMEVSDEMAREFYNELKSNK